MIEPRFDKDGITLYCADCLDVMPQLDRVDAVISDPVYNVGIKYGDRVNDSLTPEQYQELVNRHTSEYKRVAYGNVVLVLGAKRKILLPWWSSLPDAEQIIVNMGAVSNNTAKNLSIQYHSILTTINSNSKIRNLWEGIRWPEEGYYYNEDRFGHPAETPLKMMLRLISYFSDKDDIILDPFCGTGTTGVACVQLGRRFIGIEISEQYYQIAEKRIKEAMLQIRMPI